MIRTLAGITLAAGALFLGACHEDDTLNSPAAPTGGTLMSRYVAMGNSITAGYQSAGINDSTQRQSYAYLLTHAAGAPYYYQSLMGRGCAPPFTNNVSQARVGGGTSTTCDLVAAGEHPWLSNVAVPGARAIEMTNNFAIPVSASNTLTSLFLGGETQAQRMEEANPTLVSMWAGNNDVLAALTNASNPGVSAAVTSSANFNASYDAAAAAIAGTGAKALLIGVVDVTNIPYASSGATIWCLSKGVCPGVPKALPDSFIVNNNCAPNAVIGTSYGDSILVPWPKFLPLIGALTGTNHTNLDCSVDTTVVTPAEYKVMRDAVAAYNTHIQAVVAGNPNFTYWDPNPTLLAKKAAGQIPLFPDLSTVGTGGSVGFGNYFTLDGVHPSALAHKLIADSIASRLNAVFGTTIPIPVAP